MLKEFLRDSVVYGLARVVTAGIGIVSLSICAHALTPAEYGVVDMLAAVAAIVHVVIVLEIEQGMARYVNAPEGAGLRKEFASTALWFTMTAYTAFVTSTFPVAGALSKALFGTVGYHLVVRIAMVQLWAVGLMSFAQDLLRFDRLAIRSATTTVLYSLTNVGVTAFLLFVAHAGIAALLAGQAAAALLSLGLGLWFSRSAFQATFSLALCRQMLAFSAPLVPSGLGVILSMYVDRVAVARILSVSDLGVYAVGARIAGVTAVAMAGFQASISPLIYQSHHAPETPKQLARLFRVFLVLALSLIVFLGLFSWDLVRLVAPSTYLRARELFVPLGAAVVVSGIYPFSPGLWIAKRTTWIACINMGAGLLNLVLNVVLLPKVGLIGAAIATLTSALAGTWVGFVLGLRAYPVPFEWRRIAGAVSVACTASIAGKVDLTTTCGLVPGILITAFAWAVVSMLLAVILLGWDDLGRIGQRLRRSWTTAAMA